MKNELILEVGKRYVTRNGIVAEVVSILEESITYPVMVEIPEICSVEWYTLDGKQYAWQESELDIVGLAEELSAMPTQEQEQAQETTEATNLNLLIQQVVQWAHEKGIPLAPTNAHPQLQKMREEVEELEDEILLEIAHGTGDLTKIKLELGDVLVTAVLQAACWGTAVEECLALAYAKISKRTGTVVNGVFKKQGE